MDAFDSLISEEAKSALIINLAGLKAMAWSAQHGSRTPAPWREDLFTLYDMLYWIPELTHLWLPDIQFLEDAAFAPVLTQLGRDVQYYEMLDVGAWSWFVAHPEQQDAVAHLWTQHQSTVQHFCDFVAGYFVFDYDDVYWESDTLVTWVHTLHAFRHDLESLGYSAEADATEEAWS